MADNDSRMCGCVCTWLQPNVFRHMWRHNWHLVLVILFAAQLFLLPLPAVTWQLSSLLSAVSKAGHRFFFPLSQLIVSSINTFGVDGGILPMEIFDSGESSMISVAGFRQQHWSRKKTTQQAGCTEVFKKFPYRWTEIPCWTIQNFEPCMAGLSSSAPAARPSQKRLSASASPAPPLISDSAVHLTAGRGSRGLTSSPFFVIMYNQM